MVHVRVHGVLLLASVLTAGCGPGASPTSPAASPTVPMVPTFAPGNYTLMLSTPGTPPPAQPGAPPFITQVCVSVGGAALASTTLDVTVDVQGAHLIGRSTNGSLLLDVSTSGAAIGGVLSGAAANDAAGISVSVQPRPGETSIGVSGTVTSSRTMGGYADGSIQFNMSSGSYGCNSANWSLSPR